MLGASFLAGPQLFGLLAILGFGLLLPPIAILHVRHAAISPQTAILATIAGTATAVSGVGALLLNDLEPAALFFLGMWWWVVGKFSTEARVLPRAFGVVTAALAVVAFGAMAADLFGVRPWAWSLPRLLLAAWLVGLAAILSRDAGRRADAG